jgi:hypothetical protein
MSIRKGLVASACAVATFSLAPLASGAEEPVRRKATGSFNPDISLVLQGRYRSGKDIRERHISGFLGAGHEHGADRGFSVGHTELIASGAIDPYFDGLVALAAQPEGGVEVEEAWFRTPGLGSGLILKGGRFLSGIGYLNEQHSHAWDFADQTLMYQALFGEHLVQDGVQLKWLAPTETFLELGVEAARGQFFPGSEDGGDRNGPGAWAAFARIGGDVGASNSWRAGLNHLSARPRNRHSHLEDINGAESHLDFSGDSRTWIVDFVWKWAPLGNPARRNLKLQGEYFRRTEKGDVACADNTEEGGACVGAVGAYRSRQFGWYLQSVYQFMPGWRAGYRYDRLDPGTVDFGIARLPPSAAGRIGTP